MAAEVQAIAESIVREHLAAQDENFLTIKHASEKADIPEQTLRKWISQKRLPVYRSKVGRVIRVKLSEVLESAEYD